MDFGRERRGWSLVGKRRDGPWWEDEVMDLSEVRMGWTNGAEPGTEIIVSSFNLNIHHDALGVSPSPDVGKWSPPHDLACSETVVEPWGAANICPALERPGTRTLLALGPLSRKVPFSASPGEPAQQQGEGDAVLGWAGAGAAPSAASPHPLRRVPAPGEWQPPVRGARGDVLPVPVGDSV